MEGKFLAEGVRLTPLITQVPSSIEFSEVGCIRCPSVVGLTPGCRMVAKCGRMCLPYGLGREVHLDEAALRTSHTLQEEKPSSSTDEPPHSLKRRWGSSPAPLLGASVGRFPCTSRGLPSPPARTSARASLREAASWRELCAHRLASFPSPDR